jgi:hypothetical protein
MTYLKLPSSIASRQVNLLFDAKPSATQTASAPGISFLSRLNG